MPGQSRAATAQGVHDVVIAGAGPAGATCAWYLAKAGVRVALVDRCAFPRDKICGDAICSGAQAHLTRMGALQRIMAAGKGHPAAVGGMVSPGGVVAIGNSVEHIHSSPVIAIRRIDMDHEIVCSATAAGAELHESFDVVEVGRDASAHGLWHVEARDGRCLRARALVVADGAASRLARRLGIVTDDPDAVCSRAYIAADDCDFACDGVVFYRRDLLPGYCALFRQSGGQLSFCLYIIPGGPCRNRDLRRMHEKVLREDPFVSRAVGCGARVGPMRGGALRLGGIARSWGDRLIVLGDAAGQIDPLTGEGIQYGMDAAEIAAETLIDALSAGKLGADDLEIYHRRWQSRFGTDFKWSRRISLLCGRYPRLLDIGAGALRDDGGALLGAWAELMTGVKPKTGFLKPDLLLPMLRGIWRDYRSPYYLSEGDPGRLLTREGPQSGRRQSGDDTDCRGDLPPESSSS